MNEGSTHWEGCWREHHECAVAEIERLQEVIDRREMRLRDAMTALNYMHERLAPCSADRYNDDQ